MIKSFTLQVNGLPQTISNQKQLNDAIKQTKNLLSSKEIGGSQYKRLQGELGKLQTLQKQLRSDQRVAQREQEIAINKGKGSYRALNAELVNLRNRYKEMSAAERKAFGKDQLKRIGRLDRELKKLDAQMGNYQRNVGNYQSALSGLGRNAAALGRNLLASFGIVGGVSAISRAVRSGIDTINDYQDQLQKLSSITGLVGADLDDVGDRSIQLSKQFGDSASVILDGFALVGSAKPELLKDAEALAEVTKQANILSKAGGLELSEAVDALTKGLNQFNEGADKAAEFTDILATSQQLGASRVNELAEGLKVVGSVSNVVGIEFNELNAAQQALAKGGIVGAEAGTKLRNIFLALIKTGRRELNPAYTDFNQILDTLAGEIKGAEEAVDLFDKRNAGAALTLIANRDVYADLVDKVNDTGNALGQATINTDTNRNAVKELNAEWQNFILSVEDGSGALSGAFTFVIDDIKNGISVLRAFNEGDVSLRDIFLADFDTLYDKAAGSGGGDTGEFQLGAPEVSTQDNEILTDDADLERQLKDQQRLLEEDAAERAKERKKETEKLRKDLKERAQAYNENVEALIAAREREAITVAEYGERIKQAEVADRIEGLKFLLSQEAFTDLERLEFKKEIVAAEVELAKSRRKEISEAYKGLIDDIGGSDFDETLAGLEALGISESRGKEGLSPDVDSVGLLQEKVLDKYKAGLLDAATFESELERARLQERLLYLDARLQAEGLANEEYIKLAEERAGIDQKLNNNTEQSLGKLRDNAKEAAKQLGTDLLNTFFEARQAQTEREREEAVREVELRLETEADFYGQSSELRARAAEEANKKIEAINADANRKKKRDAILQAVINGALAATQALANTTVPFPASLLALVPVAAAVAGQVATIAGVGFDEGGFTRGMGVRDSTGYEIAQVNPDGTYYHSNEYVVPHRVLSTSRGMALVSELDSMRMGMGYRNKSGQMGFAEGGFRSGQPFMQPAASASMVVQAQRLSRQEIALQGKIIGAEVATGVKTAIEDGFDSARRTTERRGRQERQIIN